jgi:CDP-diacylglycerol--glycerol-3-phosphate 3-phosphatidyltransferase
MVKAQGFEFNYDLMNTLFLVGLAAVVALVYTFRSASRGRAHFDRVNRDGGSPMLGKNMMEMAYWGLQPIGRFLVYVHITPNMLSWASFVFGLLSGVVLAVGHFGFGAIFATASALLDSLDGLVARMSNRASDAGEVLDAAIDRYAEFFFLAGLLIYYRDLPVLMVLVLAALIGSFMVSYSTAKAEALQVKPPRGSMRRPERAFYLTLGAVLSPISIPWLETRDTFSVHVGYPMVIALGIVAILSNFSAAERLWAISRSVRERENRSSK